MLGELRLGYFVFRFRLLDADAEIVPRRLAGDGVRVRIAVAVFLGRQQFGNHVVEQEALFCFRRVGRQIPRARPLADRVPRPHRVLLDALHQADLDLDPAVMADHPHPVVVLKSFELGLGAVHIEPVAGMDLAQPRILRAPGMIHRHRPLGDREERVGVLAAILGFERPVPGRQRIEIACDAGPVFLGWLDIAMAERRQPETLQRLAVELQHDLVGRSDPAHAGGVFQIVLVGVLVIALIFGEFVAPETAVFDIAVKLVRVGRAGAVAVAGLAAPPRQRADPRRPFVVDQIIRVAAGIFRRAVLVGQSRQADPRAEIDQHALERPHVAVGLDHRLADRVGRPVGAADRPVEHRYRVPALEICGVGQDDVAIGHGLRPERVGIDDERDLVLAGRRIAVGQHVDHAGRVHRRIPRHVGHEHEQHVDRVGIALPRIGDDHVHHAMGAERRFPRKCLVDALRRSVGIDQQVFGFGRKAERRAGQRRVCVDLAGLARRFLRRRAGAREGRLVTEPARHIDGPEQHLQQMDRAAGVKSVRMGRDATHRVHRDGAADHLVLLAPGPVGPFDVEHDFLVERGLGQFGGDAPDMVGGDAGPQSRHLGTVSRIHIAVGHDLERRHGFAPVDQGKLADHRRGDARQSCIGDLAGILVPAQRLAVGPAGEQSVIGGAGIADHQPRRIGVAHQIVEIDLVGMEQFVDQRHDERAVAARLYPDPFVGDCRIAGLDRIDRHEFRAARLELRQAHLDRV